MIDIDSIVWSENCVDPGCRVFFVGDRIFRAYEEFRRQEALDFLDSECYAILREKGLIVNTWISDEIRVEGYPFIIEHEHLCVMPEKWLCFDMLKDILSFHFEINAFCKDYGFGLRDIGFGNVTLNKGKLCFIDFGSFRRIENIDLNTYAEGCLPLAYLPLAIYSTNDGNDFLADSMIGDYDKWRTCQNNPSVDTLLSDFLQPYLYPIVAYYRLRIFRYWLRIKFKPSFWVACIRLWARLTNRLVRFFVSKKFKGGMYAQNSFIRLRAFYSDVKAAKNVGKLKLPYQGSNIDPIEEQPISKLIPNILFTEIKQRVGRIVLWGNFSYNEIRSLRNAIGCELVVMSRDRLYTNYLYGQIRKNEDDISVVCCNAIKGKDHKVLGALKTDILVLQSNIYEQVHNDTHSDWAERTSYFAQFIITPQIDEEELRITHLRSFYELISENNQWRYQLYKNKKRK